MDIGLLCVQRRRLPADLAGGDVIFFSQPAGGDQGSRVTREVSEESLMLPDGLMDQASVTSAIHAHQEKPCLKRMTACKKNALEEGQMPKVDVTSAPKFKALISILKGGPLI